MIKWKKFIPIIYMSVSLFNTNSSFAMNCSSTNNHEKTFYELMVNRIIRRYTNSTGYEVLCDAIDAKLNDGNERYAFQDAKCLVNYLYCQSYNDCKVLYCGMSPEKFAKMSFKFGDTDFAGNLIYNEISYLFEQGSKKISPKNDLIMRYNNFLSTSVEEKIARGFGDIILKIEFDDKIHAEYIAEKSIYSGEKEVLIPPGVVFKLLNVKKIPKLSSYENGKFLISVVLTEQNNPFDTNLALFGKTN